LFIAARSTVSSTSLITGQINVGHNQNYPCVLVAGYRLISVQGDWQLFARASVRMPLVRRERSEAGQLKVKRVVVALVFIVLMIQIFEFLTLMAYQAAQVETYLIQPSLQLMMGAANRQDSGVDL